MFRQSFERSDRAAEAPSDLAVRAIVAGIRRVVYRRLRADRPEEVSEHLDELLDWALSYQGPVAPPTTSVRRRPPDAPASWPTGRELGWEEPADSARSRAGLTQRDASSERLRRWWARTATHR